MSRVAWLGAALLLGLSACGSTLNSVSANPLTIGLSAPSVSMGVSQPYAKVNVSVTYTCQLFCAEHDKAVLSIAPAPPAGMSLEFDNFNIVDFNDSDSGAPAVFSDPLRVAITSQTPAGTYNFTITATHTTPGDPILGTKGGVVETKSVNLQVVVSNSGTGGGGGGAAQVSGTISGVSSGTVQLLDLSYKVLASTPYGATGFTLALPTPSASQLTPLVVGNTCTGTQTPGLMHLPTNLGVTRGTSFSSIAPTSDPHLLNLLYVDRAGTVDQTCQEGTSTAHYSEVFGGAGWYGFINNAGTYTVKPVASLGHSWQ